MSSDNQETTFDTPSTRKRNATLFEASIKNMLQDLEFEDVDGARDNFLINGVQIDVCGGWGNALLVIECKTKQKLGKKDLRAAISELRGKIPLLEKGFKNHPVYKKYTFFKYIIVTKNIVVKKPDLDFANERPSIYIWNENFLEYYQDLYSYIKPYAKYDLLGEMRIRPLYEQPITIPAFQVKFGNVNVYNFVMNPKDLIEIAFVARREVKNERYYQRMINKDRLTRMARYIEDGGRFPNNIIIAFDENLPVKFSPVKGPNYSMTDWPYEGIAYGILEFPKDYRSCWIIDGQHRLYAFVNLKKDFYFHMPITAFEHLNIEEQRKFFLDINKNQKPVDPDLLWDLSGDIPTEKEGIISNSVKYLNSNFDSSLFHRIYYPSTGIRDKKGKIKISALCIAMKKRRIVDETTLENVKNPLYLGDSFDKHTQKVSGSLSRFFNVLRENFPHNWQLADKGFILTNGGIAVMIGLFEKILSRIMHKENREAQQQDYEFYMLPLKEILESSDIRGLKNLRLRTTSEGGKSDVLDEFIQKIRAYTKDDRFGGEIKSSFEGVFEDLERKLKDLIRRKLSVQYEEDWFKESVDSETYGRAVRIMEKNGITDRDKLHLQMTLGDCFATLRRHQSLFYPIFIDEKKEYSFDQKMSLEAAFALISSMRAKLGAHHTGAKVKLGDEDLLKIYLEKLDRCIEGELEESLENRDI